MKTPIQELLEGQRLDGTLDSEGAFRIDVLKASSKLEAYQLVHRSDYLVKFFQLAHYLSSGDFQLIVGLTRNKITFPCAGREIDELSKLPSILLEGEEPTSILAHLLTGLRTGLFHHRRIVCSLDDQAFLSIDSKKVDWYGWPQLAVRSRPRFEASFFRKGWFRGLADIHLRSEEQTCLERRTIFSSLSARVDGRKLRRGWTRRKHAPGRLYILEAYLDSDPELPDFDFFDNSGQQFTSAGGGLWTWNHRSLKSWQGERTPTKHLWLRGARQGRTIRCSVAVRVGGHKNSDSNVVFLVAGASAGVKKIDLGLPGTDVVLSGDGLTTDISEFQIVENELFKKRIDALAKRVEFLGPLLEKIRG